MLSIDFIKRKLTDISRVIKNIRLRYGYDQLANTHVIEVSPKNIYDDDKYILLETSILNDFYANFSNECITFITEDDIPGIEEEEFYVEGLEYSPYSYKDDSEIQLSTPNVINNEISFNPVNFEQPYEPCTVIDFPSFRSHCIHNNNFHLAA